MTIQIHYADTLRPDQYTPMSVTTRSSRGYVNPIGWAGYPIGQTINTVPADRTILPITGPRSGGSSGAATESRLEFPFSPDLLSTTTNDRIMIGFKAYGAKPSLTSGWNASYYPLEFGPFSIGPSSSNKNVMTFMGQTFPSPFDNDTNNGVPVLMILDVDTSNRSRGTFTLLIAGEVKVIITTTIPTFPANRIRNYTAAGSGSLTNLVASMPAFIGDIFFATGGQRGEAIMNWDFQKLQLVDASPAPDPMDWEKTEGTFAASVAGPGLETPTIYATAISDNVPLKFTTSSQLTYPNFGGLIGYVDGLGLGTSQAGANSHINIKVNDKSFASSFPLYVTRSASLLRMLTKEELGWGDDVNITSVEIVKNTR